MKINYKDVVKNLPKKGFKEEPTTKNKRHRFFRYYHDDGKKTIVKTWISRGSKKDIDRDLISFMRKQLKLDTNRQFKDLIECPMSKDEYKRILKEKKEIS